MKAKLRAKNDVRGRPSNTTAGTVKIKRYACGSSGRSAGLPCVWPVLVSRSEASGNCYPGIPCVIAERLIAGYERNTKIAELRLKNVSTEQTAQGLEGNEGRKQLRAEFTGTRSGFRGIELTVGTLEFGRWRPWPVRRKIVPPRRPLQDDDKEGPCQRRP
jgi:hypothetical protein